MPSIEIDGEIYQVDADANLLQACLSLGLDLPYFCWHPAMGSVGACRQCAVVQFSDRHDQSDCDQHDEQGRIIMSCMTPVTEGMRISIAGKTAKDFRADVIELLMTNHPHDCPVCEEGGECHLQDMTIMSGHNHRRYQGDKRTHRNQYLGPFINHEMNRCIACYRCERYYQDYAGGHDLQAMAAHNNVFFGRHEDGTLESEFAGNLVEVCPTGVFTDKTLSERYVRKWDIQTAPSICAHCALGCNTSPGERYGELRRVVNRYNGEVNGYFLCDRGRFGYGFVNNEDRLKQAVHLNPDGRTNLSRSQLADTLRQTLQDSKGLIGIGSPRTSLEDNFALRELVGADNFYPGYGDTELALHRLVVQILKQYPVRSPSLADVEKADAVLILGEDVLNTAPRLALSLRQAVRNEALNIADELNIPHWQDAAVRGAAQAEKSPLYITAFAPTGIDDIAKQTYFSAADDMARLGFAIAHAIDPSAPMVAELSEEQQSLAQVIAADLKAANKPLLVSGTGCQSEAVIQATANIAQALNNLSTENTEVDLMFCLPECNSMGVALMAANDPVGGEGRLSNILGRIQNGDADTVVILGNDLYRRMPVAEADRLLTEIPQVISLDHNLSRTGERSHLALPAATFAEAEGTLVSSEGRAQRFFPALLPTQDVRPAWEWLADMKALKHDEGIPWQHCDEITAACADAFPALAGILDAAPSAAFRKKGMKVARQTHRYSGRTAMRADINVAEPKQPVDADSALGFTMEGFPGEKPAAITPYYWSPGWNSNQSISKFQDEVGGGLKGGDPGVRLIEPQLAEPKLVESNGSPKADWFSPASATTASQSGTWMPLPQYHIFGSEELSGQTAAIRERGGAPRVSLNPEDAASLGVSAGSVDSTDVGLALSQADFETALGVIIEPSLAVGTVGIPMGFTEISGIDLAANINLAVSENWCSADRPPQIIATDSLGNNVVGSSADTEMTENPDDA